MECQKLLVENTPDYDVVLEEAGQTSPELPWDLEDQLCEEWRDRQWQREQRQLEGKVTETEEGSYAT